KSNVSSAPIASSDSLSGFMLVVGLPHLESDWAINIGSAFCGEVFSSIMPSAGRPRAIGTALTGTIEVAVATHAKSAAIKNLAIRANTSTTLHLPQLGR